MSNKKRHIKKQHKNKVRIPTIIFTLFGAYIIPRGREVWIGNLIKLLNTFSLSDNAIRLGLSRMSRQKLLRSRKKGRNSYYSLSKKGYDWMLCGRHRGLERECRPWDKKWRLLIYNIPEKLRSKRDALRKKLHNTGYGSLGPSIWLSPYDFKEELTMFIDKLKVSDHIERFEAKYTWFREERELIYKAWNIKDLEERYEKFIARYTHLLLTFKKKALNKENVDAGECFAERFRSSAEFIEIALFDPMLPGELLPDDWAGFKAMEIYKKYQDILASEANRFVDEILKIEIHLHKED